MLEDNKKLYSQYADVLIGESWRKENKNTLVHKYVEFEKSDPKLASAYMSAILCRYWNNIDKYYHQCHNSVSVQDCYDWLVRSVTYAIQRRSWLDPKATIYNDPNGPDKAINRVIQSTRQGFFQSSNTWKRKANFGIASIDKMVEDSEGLDSLPVIEITECDPMSIDLDTFMATSLQKKDYAAAFVVDGIINGDTFITVKEDSGKKHLEFSTKRLMRHLRTIEEPYCKSIAYHYKVDPTEVWTAVAEYKDFSALRLKGLIKRQLKNLKSTSAFALGTD